jgi:hypothetical protein
MWIKMVNANASVLMDFSNGVSSDNVHFVTYNPGVCSFPAYFQVLSNASYSMACMQQFPSGVWLHVTVTYSILNLTSSAYVNGSLITSVGSQMQLRNLTRGTNYFGANSWGMYGNWMFDEVKFHSRVLSAQEVWNDMTYGKSYISFV